MIEKRILQAIVAVACLLPLVVGSMGIVHGGMLATFLDGLLARAVHGAAGGQSVTLHLSMDFLSAARQGQWVYGEAQVTRAAKEITFAQARIHADGKDILRGSGVFKRATPKS